MYDKNKAEKEAISKSENASNLNNFTVLKLGYVYSIIDKIFKEIENQKCMNCKYLRTMAMSGYECTSNSVPIYEISAHTDLDEFGCSGFEKGKYNV